VIDLMDGLGRPLFPWQQLVIRHGLGQVQTPELEQRWAASQCGCWVPRQNGKGDIIMALELGWLYLFGERLVLHSAHEYKTAQEGFLRIRDVIKGSADLDRLVNRYWQANGEQGIELIKKAGGARLRFMARTRGSGRGFTAGKIVLDEAQELTEAQVRAILHVVSAVPNWQIWFFGTPPQPDVEGGSTSSAWIYNLKEAGESGAPRTAWFDWGIPTLDLEDPADLAKLRDRQTWLDANPSAGRLIDLETIESQLMIGGVGQGFAMERCGMWLPRATDRSLASIDPEKWRQAALPEQVRADPVKSRPRPGQLVITFHVNARRTHATIGYAGKAEDGRWLVGIIDHKRGTEWLLDRLVRLCESWRPIAVCTDTASETLLDELAEHGIRLPEVAEHPQRGDLIIPTSKDVATAYGLLVDAANNGQLWHRDEIPLNTAVTAPPRPLGGGSTWDHKRGIEVGPAKCVDLSMWAFREWDGKVGSYDPLANIW